ncbi:MAG: CbtA family protein, partial [Pseudonocardia sp.]
LGALLPAIRETPADFPAVVLYDFRLASMGIQIVFWTVLALTLPTLVQRASRSTPSTTALVS